MTHSSFIQDKVALITGGNSGIGRATAELWLEHGGHAVITGRRADAVETTARELGPRAVGFVADAGDTIGTEKMLSEVRARYDRIELLFLNAGIASFSPVETQGIPEFDELMRTNVRGPYFTLQAALPLLGSGSAVVLNTSVVRQKGLAGTSAYAATKGALRSMVRVAAGELASRGIRVNAVAPGPIETPLYDKMGMAAEALDQMTQHFAQMVPLGRFGRSREVAEAVLFLGTSRSSFITGVELAVDGGLSQV